MQRALSPGTKPDLRASTAAETSTNPATTAKKLLAISSGLIAAVVALGALAIAASASAQEPWGFEQVTPVEKGAGAIAYVDTFRASTSGDSMLYTTGSSFSSVPAKALPMYTRYAGIRGDDGWTNRPVDPPFNLRLIPNNFAIMMTLASSSDLSHVVVNSPNALTPGATEGGTNLYVRNTHTGELTLVATDDDPSMTAQAANLQGSSYVKYVASDGNTVVFNSNVPLTPDAGTTTLYKWTESHGLEAVSVLPESEGGATGYGAIPISQTGPRSVVPLGNSFEHVYFQTHPDDATGGIYVRTGDQTRPVSYSRIPGDPTTTVRADIDSTSDNGESVLFHTRDSNTRLTEDTPDIGNALYLYRYDYATDALTYIGHSISRSGMEPLQMSKDGTTVAFQSDAVLDDGATAGGLNLYVWRDGETRLVTTSDPGSTPGSNGAFWIRMMSENGDYYAFSDSSTSLASQFGLDIVSSNCPTQFGAPGPCDQVYLYDVEAEALDCVSCRTDGEPPSGKAGDPGADNSGYVRMDTHAAQIVANDGTVFFTTADPLVRRDANGAPDVYAYKDGELRLITRAAQGATYSRFLDATADGKKVFIATNDAIVHTDTDKAVDIYMTGPGAGFDHAPPDVLPPCEGRECRDPVDPLPDLPPAGSVDFEGAGNEKVVVERLKEVVVKRQKRSHGAAAKLRITVPTAGKLKVSGRKIRNKAKRVSEAGKYRINVRLNKRGKRRLQKRNRVRVPIKVRFNPAEGRSSSTRVGITFKANSTKKGR